jgi:BirA family transcriptional regulator, biotin operon repressor / biotin---[acetyl-CoA-carboxylase] ligase
VTTSTEALLQCFLKHPQTWLSGNQLANHLQVSRTMVWKMIQQLKQAGHQIESKSHLGYRYTQTFQINSTVLQTLLPESYTVIVKDSLPSTNSYAKQLYDQTHSTKSQLILAKQQTQGYGRRGRQFYSPADHGLYMTLLVPLTNPKHFNPGLLTTMLAVIVAQALQIMYPSVDFKVKWINDVYVGTKKVAGILTELVMDAELMQPSALVIGIGINLTASQLPVELQSKVGAISDQPIDVNQLVAHIVQRFEAEYPDYTAGDFLPEYQKRSFLQDKTVTIQTAHQTVTGTVTGINQQGYLLVQTADKIVAINNGEVVKVNF